MSNRINQSPKSSLSMPSAPAGSASKERSKPRSSGDVVSTFERMAPQQASSKCAAQPKGFAGRVVDEMAANWPGSSFMAMLAAAPALAVGAPLLALAAGVAAPVLMGVHQIKQMEAAYGPGVNGNGRRC